jgi:hypothetical protein
MKAASTPTLTRIFALLIWLVSAAFGLLSIYMLRQTFLNLSIYINMSAAAAVNLSNWLLFLLALIWLVFAFGTLEYHLKHAGEKRSWKIFATTFGVELFILILFITLG